MIHSVRSEALDWLEEAEADLAHAKASAEMNHYSWSCFAAQQACEKALKALALVTLRRRPLHLHDLTKLYSDVEPRLKLKRAVVEGLAELSSFYTLARYPNAGLTKPSKSISKRQAERAIKISESVVREIRRVIEAT